MRNNNKDDRKHERNQFFLQKKNCVLSFFFIFFFPNIQHCLNTLRSDFPTLKDNSCFLYRLCTFHNFASASPHKWFDEQMQRQILGKYVKIVVWNKSCGFYDRLLCSIPKKKKKKKKEKSQSLLKENTLLKKGVKFQTHLLTVLNTQ